MIDVNKAKQKILDMAIRGKLTKQHHKDGNINDEIKYYINNVEIENEFKKNKKQVKINAIEELPFDIPKTWSWVRLGNVCSIFGRIGYRGYTKDDIVDDGDGAISLSPSNLVGFGKMDYSNCTYISWDKYNESPEIMVNNEDIIIVKTGSSYGKTGFVSNLQKRATINPQLAILKYLQGNRKYILIILNTVFVKKQLDDFVLGSAVPTFSQEDLANLMIPIPPLAEQNRIVEKVDKLFEILDKIDEAQKKYQKDKEILKSKIIEAGIRGKLTKQLKSDGDVSDLLDEIRKEKEKLIKEGKIKRDKKETYIYKNPKDNLYYEKHQDGTEKCIQDELPFEIPKNWVWCHLNNISYNVGSMNNQIKTSEMQKMGKVPVISQGQDLIDGYTDEMDKIVNDTPLILFGDHTRCVKYIDYAFVIGADGVKLHKVIRCIDKYVYYWMKIAAKQMISNGYARHHSLLLEEFVPLPPLAEQERIVNRIEELFNTI